jgi:hypothetical protein
MFGSTLYVFSNGISRVRFNSQLCLLRALGDSQLLHFPAVPVPPSQGALFARGIYFLAKCRGLTFFFACSRSSYRAGSTPRAAFVCAGRCCCRPQSMVTASVTLPASRNSVRQCFCSAWLEPLFFASTPTAPITRYPHINLLRCLSPSFQRWRWAIPSRGHGPRGAGQEGICSVHVWHGILPECSSALMR